MLSMIDEFDKKKDIHVVDNNGDKRPEWKKALHQVLSEATVFTSFDLFLAELPFPQLSAPTTLVLIFEVPR